MLLLRYCDGCAQGPEVEYSLRLFPLGGYVGFPDDDPDSKIPADDPDLLRNRPVKDRFIVISAGVIANFIFAYSLLVTQVSPGPAALGPLLQGLLHGWLRRFGFMSLNSSCMQSDSFGTL